MIKVKFPKGVRTVHVPFLAELGSYDQLHKQMKKVKYPKSVRRIEASITCSIDLRKGETSYELAQVSVHK